MISLVALGITTLLHRRGAAVRHLALVTGLTACLLTPAAVLLPSIVTVRVPLSTSLVAALSPALANAPVIGRDAADLSARTTGNASVPLALMLAVWLVGMLGLVIRIVRESIIAAHLRFRAVAASGHGWTSIIAAVEAQLGTVERLDVRLSAEVDVPLVSGVRRPVVVVPASSNEWPAEQRRLVLLHEGAHVVRRDLLARAIGATACAMHWYNPFLWLLAARADELAERSADDSVLHSGVRPSDYASLLMSFAEQLRWHPRARPVLMLAHRGTLAPRVRAVLAATTPRSVVDRRTQMEYTALCAVVVAAAGAIRIAPLPVVRTEPVRRDRVVEVATPRDTVVAPAFEAMLPVVPGWRDDAIRALLDLRQDPSPQVRASAVEALERLRHD